MNGIDFKVCFYTAWVRISVENQNLKIGLFWEPLSLFAVVVFLSVVWGKVMNASSKVDYFFYVLIGFLIWSLMSRCIDQCLSFKSRSYVEMRRGATTLSNQIYVALIYCIIQFLFIFPIVFVLSLAYYQTSILSLMCILLSLCCVLITSYGLLSSLALIVVFYEDIARLIRTIMRVAFLLTPILWYPEMLGVEYESYMYINPFFSYLDVFRSGMMDLSVSHISIIVMLFLSLFFYCLGKFCFYKLETLILEDVHLEKNVS